MEAKLIHESGVMVFTPNVFRDNRGTFIEGHRVSEIAPFTKFPKGFVQSCVSRSAPFVLRGLHYQLRKGQEFGQGKLIRCVAGRAYQVSVDMREGSKTFGQWVNHLLDEKTLDAVWVPPGFANGFLAMEQGAVMQYEMTEYHDPALERQLFWGCGLVGIRWPGGGKHVSQKDKDAPRLDTAERWK